MIWVMQLAFICFFDCLVLYGVHIHGQVHLEVVSASHRLALVVDQDGLGGMDGDFLNSHCCLNLFDPRLSADHKLVTREGRH